MKQAVVANSPEYASGTAVNPATVNWDNVVLQVQHEVTPEQWAQIQPTIPVQQVQRQLGSAAAEDSTLP